MSDIIAREEIVENSLSIGISIVFRHDNLRSLYKYRRRQGDGRYAVTLAVRVGDGVASLHDATPVGDFGRTLVERLIREQRKQSIKKR